MEAVRGWVWIFSGIAQSAAPPSSFDFFPRVQQQQQHFISPHNIQEIKIYNISTDDDRGAGCPK